MPDHPRTANTVYWCLGNMFQRSQSALPSGTMQPTGGREKAQSLEEPSDLGTWSAGQGLGSMLPRCLGGGIVLLLAEVHRSSLQKSGP